jgi:hypothetical protein
VSLQFHCTFDSNFETLKENNIPASLWQEKAHFVIKTKEKGSNEDVMNDAKIQPMVEQESANETVDIPRLANTSELEPPIQQDMRAQEGNENEEQEQLTTRSGQIRKPPTRFKDYVMGNQVIAQQNSTYMDGEVMNPPTVLDILEQKSIADPDTLYLWQARKEPDFPRFM